MSITAADVMQETAEVFLNDSGRAHYTNAVLLPFLKKAMRDLQLELFRNGIVFLDEITAPITLPALQTNLTTGSLLPTDLIEPVELHERAQTTDNWQPMFMKQWEPTEDPAQYVYLYNWAWREQDVKFRGCNRIMYILLKYRKELSAIANENSTIALFNSQPYLSSRTGFYAAGFGGGNLDRAKAARAVSDEALAKLMQIETREQQQPVRRRGYGAGRRLRKA